MASRYSVWQFTHHKMHDSLPLHPFARDMILSVFIIQWGLTLFAMLSWFLQISGLTTSAFSTKSRCHMFEMTFYLLDFYHKLMETMKLSPDSREQIGQGRRVTLYTGLQIRDALNMSCILIIILRISEGPIRLHRNESDGLEHLFGKTRVRCREVNTTKCSVSGLTEEFLKLQSSHFLELNAVSKSKTSIWVDCEPKS
jgi:hypothetical protein